MKLIMCGKCMDIRGLPANGVVAKCDCGNVEAWWEDSRKGTVEVRAREMEWVRVIGLHNAFLRAAFDGVPLGDNQFWRKKHEEVTDAKGYIFDKSARSCWASIFRVGETSDVSVYRESSSPAHTTEQSADKEEVA